MPYLPLPVPDATGIYDFPRALRKAHHDRQLLLAAEECDGASVARLTAPWDGDSYFIKAPEPRGRPLVVIEPHHDDTVLSAAGTLLAEARPLTVVTVFTRSVSAHAEVQTHHEGEEAISRLRADEGREALRAFDADQVLLGYPDARPPYQPYDPALLEKVTADLAAVCAAHEGAELLAPAAVTRHPDHLLVHEAARRLGCTSFWEDLAFWQTYGMSPDDQQLFTDRTGATLAPELSEITGTLLDKLTLLYLHASQLPSRRAMYRPIRHAWTTAAELRDTPHQARYAERFYRTAEAS